MLKNCSHDSVTYQAAVKQIFELLDKAVILAGEAVPKLGACGEYRLAYDLCVIKSEYTALVRSLDVNLNEEV